MIFLLSFFLYFPWSHAEEIVPVGLIEELHGKAVIYSIEGNKTDALASGPIYSEDIIETDPNSWLDLVLTDGSKIRIGADTKFQVNQEDNEQSEFHWITELIRGNLRAWVKEGEKENIKFELKTKFASVGVRGTEFVTSIVGDELEVYTMSGNVLVSDRQDNEGKANWGKAISVLSQEVSRVGLRRQLMKENYRSLPKRLERIHNRPLSHQPLNRVRDRLKQIQEKRQMNRGNQFQRGQQPNNKADKLQKFQQGKKMDHRMERNVPSRQMRQQMPNMQRNQRGPRMNPPRSMNRPASNGPNRMRPGPRRR